MHPGLRRVLRDVDIDAARLPVGDGLRLGALRFGRGPAVLLGLGVDADAGERLAQVARAGGGHLLREGVGEAAGLGFDDGGGDVLAGAARGVGADEVVLAGEVLAQDRQADGTAPRALEPLKDLVGVGLRLDQVEVVALLGRRTLRRGDGRGSPEVAERAQEALSLARLPRPARHLHLPDALAGGLTAAPRIRGREAVAQVPLGRGPDRAPEPRRALRPGGDEEPLAIAWGDGLTAVQRLHVPLPQRPVVLDRVGGPGLDRLPQPLVLLIPAPHHLGERPAHHRLVGGEIVERAGRAEAGPVGGEPVARIHSGVGVVGRVEAERMRAEGGEALLKRAVHVGVAAQEVGEEPRAQEDAPVVLVEHRAQGGDGRRGERLLVRGRRRERPRLRRGLALDGARELLRGVVGDGVDHSRRELKKEPGSASSSSSGDADGRQMPPDSRRRALC